jgi:hypothetical protein
MTLQEAFPTGSTAWAILCPNSSGESAVSQKFILSQNGNSPHLGPVAYDCEYLKISWLLKQFGWCGPLEGV